MTLTNPVHIAFLVAVALIFLGPKRLPELARSLGTGMREFRETLGGGAHHDEAPPLTAQGEVTAAQPSVEEIVAAPPGPTAR